MPDPPDVYSCNVEDTPDDSSEYDTGPPPPCGSEIPVEAFRRISDSSSVTGHITEDFMPLKSDDRLSAKDPEHYVSDHSSDTRAGVPENVEDSPSQDSTLNSNLLLSGRDLNADSDEGCNTERSRPFDTIKDRRLPFDQDGHGATESNGEMVGAYDFRKPLSDPHFLPGESFSSLPKSLLKGPSPEMEVEDINELDTSSSQNSLSQSLPKGLNEHQETNDISELDAMGSFNSLPQSFLKGPNEGNDINEVDEIDSVNTLPQSLLKGPRPGHEVQDIHELNSGHSSHSLPHSVLSNATQPRSLLKAPGDCDWSTDESDASSSFHTVPQSLLIGRKRNQELDDSTSINSHISFDSLPPSLFQGKNQSTEIQNYFVDGHSLVSEKSDIHSTRSESAGSNTSTSRASWNSNLIVAQRNNSSNERTESSNLREENDGSGNYDDGTTGESSGVLSSSSEDDPLIALESASESIDGQDPSRSSDPLLMLESVSETEEGMYEQDSRDNDTDLSDVLSSGERDPLVVLESIAETTEGMYEQDSRDNDLKLSDRLSSGEDDPLLLLESIAETTEGRHEQDSRVECTRPGVEQKHGKRNEDPAKAKQDEGSETSSYEEVTVDTEGTAHMHDCAVPLIPPFNHEGKSKVEANGKQRAVDGIHEELEHEEEQEVEIHLEDTDDDESDTVDLERPRNGTEESHMSKEHNQEYTPPGLGTTNIIDILNNISPDGVAVSMDGTTPKASQGAESSMSKNSDALTKASGGSQELRSLQSEVNVLRTQVDEMKSVQQEAAKLKRERDTYFLQVKDLEEHSKGKLKGSQTMEKDPHSMAAIMHLLEENESLMNQMKDLKNLDSVPQQEQSEDGRPSENQAWENGVSGTRQEQVHEVSVHDGSESYDELSLNEEDNGPVIRNSVIASTETELNGDTLSIPAVLSPLNPISRRSTVQAQDCVANSPAESHDSGSYKEETLPDEFNEGDVCISQESMVSKMQAQLIHDGDNAEEHVQSASDDGAEESSVDYGLHTIEEDGAEDDDSELNIRKQILNFFSDHSENDDIFLNNSISPPMHERLRVNLFSDHSENDDIFLNNSISRLTMHERLRVMDSNMSHSGSSIEEWKAVDSCTSLLDDNSISQPDEEGGHDVALADMGESEISVQKQPEADSISQKSGIEPLSPQTQVESLTPKAQVISSSPQTQVESSSPQTQVESSSSLQAEEESPSIQAELQSESGSESEICCNTCGLDCAVVGEAIPCSECKEVYYCSPECVKWDWEKGGHAKVCSRSCSKKSKKKKSPKTDKRKQLSNAAQNGPDTAQQRKLRSKLRLVDDPLKALDEQGSTDGDLSFDVSTDEDSRADDTTGNALGTESHVQASNQPHLYVPVILNNDTGDSTNFVEDYSGRVEPVIQDSDGSTLVEECNRPKPRLVNHEDRSLNGVVDSDVNAKLFRTHVGTHTDIGSSWLSDEESGHGGRRSGAGHIFAEFSSDDEDFKPYGLDDGENPEMYSDTSSGSTGPLHKSFNFRNEDKTNPVDSDMAQSSDSDYSSGGDTETTGPPMPTGEETEEAREDEAFVLSGD